jgi:hypothetical protein
MYVNVKERKSYKNYVSKFPVALLIVLAAVSVGSALCEKKWTGYSMSEMRTIAAERVNEAMKLISESAVEESARTISWEDANPDTWAPAVVEWFDEAIGLFPPQKGNSRVRLKLLEVMDVVVHLEFNPQVVAALDRMYHRRVDKAVEEIVSTPGVSGARVWKIYNMGFVVMTKNHCLAFDVHPGKVVTPLSDAQVEALAERCDAFFLSHRHGDHWEARILDAFSERGRPVISPEGDFWQGPTLKVIRKTGKEPLDLGGIKVWVYPGNQFGSALCNLYVVEADGMVISHNGDMSAPHPWVLTLKKRHDVDVQLLNCWALPSFNARGQKAKMIVTGHEWEIGHDINGRRGFDETQALLDNKFKRIKLLWGERADYPGPSE